MPPNHQDSSTYNTFTSQNFKSCLNLKFLGKRRVKFIFGRYTTQESKADPWEQIFPTENLGLGNWFSQKNSVLEIKTGRKIEPKRFIFFLTPRWALVLWSDVHVPPALENYWSFNCRFITQKWGLSVTDAKREASCSETVGSLVNMCKKDGVFKHKKEVFWWQRLNLRVFRWKSKVFGWHVWRRWVFGRQHPNMGVWWLAHGEYYDMWVPTRC